MIQGDIGDRKTAKYNVEAMLDSFRKINILINNAAVQYQQHNLTDIDNDQLGKTFRTNIFSMFYLTAFEHWSAP